MCLTSEFRPQLISRHEYSGTIVKVGKNLAGKYHEGQNVACQPDFGCSVSTVVYGLTVNSNIAARNATFAQPTIESKQFKVSRYRS